MLFFSHNASLWRLYTRLKQKAGSVRKNKRGKSDIWFTVWINSIYFFLKICLKFKKICFLTTYFIQMFNCCLIHLIGQSRSSDWMEHLQQRFIYANRNGIFTSSRFHSLQRNVQDFQWVQRETVLAERTAPADGPHQVSPPYPPTHPTPLLVREQQEAQATFNSDSPNQVRKRSEKMWSGLTNLHRWDICGRAENVDYHPPSPVLMLLHCLNSTWASKMISTRFNTLDFFLTLLLIRY